MNTSNPGHQTIIINGDHFCDLQGFYSEVERVIANGPCWRSDNNLMAFKRLLAGETGALSPQQPVTLIWKNASKSRSDFSRISNGLHLYMTIIDIISSQEHIKFIEQ